MEKQIITLTGPSGAGKSTIVKELLKQRPEWKLIVSVTTREKRESDLPGEYDYVSEDKFKYIKENGKFIWTAEPHGKRYGTMYESIDSALVSPQKSLMILEPASVSALFNYTKQVAPFYIYAPSEDELEKRLVLRGDAKESIERRISDCRSWDKLAKESAVNYTYILNRNVADAVENILMNL